MRTGIILAGGDSKRIGTDKGLIDLNGKHLISYVIESLRPVVDEIIVVVGSEERIHLIGRPLKMMFILSLTCMMMAPP